MSVARYGPLLHLCAAAGVLCYAAATVSLWVLVLGACGVLAGWWVTGRPGGRAIPRMAVNALLVLGGLLVLPRLLDGLNVADFATVVLVLLTLKLLDRRAPRDDAQVLMLVAFLCVAAVLTSNSLWVGLVLLVTGPLLLWCVFAYHIAAAGWRSERGREEVRRIASGAAVGAPMPVSIEGPEGMRWSLRRLAALMWALSAVAGTVFFFVAPRSLAPEALGDWGGSSVGRVTGFNDEIELGAGGLLSDSAEVVLDLVLTDGLGSRRGGDLEAHYLRGAVLTEYENGRWRSAARSYRGRAGAEIDNEWIPVQRPAQGGTQLVQRITLRNAPKDHGPLFAIWRPIEIRSQDRVMLSPRQSDGVLERLGRGGKLTYEVKSVVDEPAIEGLPRLVTSFDSEIVRSEAERVLEAGRVPADPFVRASEQTEFAIRLIEEHLRSTCKYTTSILPARGDPVDWFLGESREGHCEYFASAMAAMCRSVGINARVVTGYVAAEWNSTTLHYTVRESDAHAWVEAEARPGQWKTYDPTPPAEFGAIHQPAVSTIERLRRLVDAAEFAWINLVVSYKGPADQESGALVGTMNHWAGRLNEVIGTTAEGDIRDERLVFGVSALVVTGAGLVVGFGLVLALLLLSRRVRLFGGGTVHGPRYYRRLLRRWRRHGVGKPAHRPPLAHLEAIGRSLGDGGEAEQARRLIERYYRERFGGARG